MDWFDKNPYGNNPSWIQSARWDINRFGRQQFVSNYARNGLSAMLFAPTPGSAFKAAWGKTHQAGSLTHMRNLRQLANRYPDNPNIINALQKVEESEMMSLGTKKSVFGKVGNVIGKGLSHSIFSAGFYGYTFATTPGSLAEKSKATVSEVVGMQAFRVGMAAGAAVGTAILPGIGTVVGGLVGGFGAQIAASSATQFVFNTTDRMIQKERDRRNLNWAGDTSAFNTEAAYTMRQRSLSAMNRGMSTARSALGREAIMVHQ
jgi:hypothetical protein